MIDKTDAYLETIARLEPEIAMIDAGAFHASAAISLKRIADNLQVANQIAVKGWSQKEIDDLNKTINEDVP